MTTCCTSRRAAARTGSATRPRGSRVPEALARITETRHADLDGHRLACRVNGEGPALVVILGEDRHANGLRRAVRRLGPAWSLSDKLFQAQLMDSAVRLAVTHVNVRTAAKSTVLSTHLA